MKHLVVYSHPNFGSFSHAILDVVRETLDALKHDVVVRDLYALDFNPVLSSADFAALHAGDVPSDVKAEQDYIVWSDMVTVIHPIW